MTAIVRRERLPDVERRLVAIGVGGITVTAVKGFGEYANYFRGDYLVPHVRIEIFTTAERVSDLTGAILDEAGTGLAGDGLIAVLPVENVIRVRTKQSAEGGTL
ncbi:MAG: P-II family nitrogen regulator [Vicinamibacterales bacterium]